MNTSNNRYAAHRYPSEIISYAAWLYHRLTLSFRVLAERGIVVSFNSDDRELYAKRQFKTVGLREKHRGRTFVQCGAVHVGIDSLNIDSTDDGQRPVHSILLQAGIPITEHLANLTQLPDSGFRYFAVPAKVAGAGSFPVRAFAASDVRPRSWLRRQTSAQRVRDQACQ